jgi:hypothetical protein
MAGLFPVDDELSAFLDGALASNCPISFCTFGRSKFAFASLGIDIVGNGEEGLLDDEGCDDSAGPLLRLCVS